MKFQFFVVVLYFSETRMGDLVEQLHEPSRITASVAGNAKQQFADVSVQAQNVHQSKFNREQCMDLFSYNDKMQAI